MSRTISLRVPMQLASLSGCPAYDRGEETDDDEHDEEDHLSSRQQQPFHPRHDLRLPLNVWDIVARHCRATDSLSCTIAQREGAREGSLVAKDQRETIIKLLSTAEKLADDLQGPTFAYLIERAIDEVRAGTYALQGQAPYFPGGD